MTDSDEMDGLGLDININPLSTSLTGANRRFFNNLHYPLPIPIQGPAVETSE